MIYATLILVALTAVSFYLSGPVWVQMVLLVLLGISIVAFAAIWVWAKMMGPDND